MRRLPGVLREDGGDVALAPQPSLDHLDVLVRHVREAGLPVDVRVEGAPRELAPAVDLSAYRIVQEALTNALKHAGPTSARVLIRYGEDSIQLEVEDSGKGAAAGPEGGHGLAGIRERVELFGGDLESGPRGNGGYAVRATLPL
jgi:signal transduction histidine kinase